MKLNIQRIGLVLETGPKLPGDRRSRGKASLIEQEIRGFLSANRARQSAKDAALSAHGNPWRLK